MRSKCMSPSKMEETGCSRVGERWYQFYDAKPWIDLFEQELRKGLEKLAGVDVQKTSNADFAARSTVW